MDTRPAPWATSSREATFFYGELGDTTVDYMPACHVNASRHFRLLRHFLRSSFVFSHDRLPTVVVVVVVVVVQACRGEGRCGTYSVSRVGGGEKGA